jgi:hypothetical protein
MKMLQDSTKDVYEGLLMEKQHRFVFSEKQKMLLCEITKMGLLYLQITAWFWAAVRK